MTVAIASYQRRDRLRRLLAALSDQLSVSEELRRDLDIVVVLDGSTDGSDEMLGAMHLPVPLTVRAESHRGLAATRNAGIETARGEYVWFLDDDLVPAEDLVRRRREAQARSPSDIIVGGTPIPVGIPVVEELRLGWERHYRQLTDGALIDGFEYVSFANTTGPTFVFRDVGGFDEMFTGYGFEDWELGQRLLDGGARIRFAGDAVAWHHADTVDVELMRARSEDDGRGLVKFALKHQTAGEQLAESWSAARGMRLLGALRVRSPRALAGASALAARAERIGRPIVGARCAGLLRSFSRSAAIAAGVADLDDHGVVLSRLLRLPERSR